MPSTLRVPVDAVVVDNTILSSVAACDTQAAMRHGLGLTIPTEAVELRCGSAVHEGLATWLVTGDPRVALARFDRVYKPWAREHVPAVDAEGKPSRLRWEPVHRILEHWLATHELKTWPFVVKPEEVEVPLMAPLLPGVMMVALLDAIGKKRTGGGRWSVDHKTGRSLNAWWKDRQEDSAQFTGQMWLAREAAIALNGVFINGLELPALHTSKSKCAKHGTTYAQCALAHVGTMVFPVTRTAHEIDAWEDTARAYARRYLQLRKVRDVKDVRDLKMQGRFTGACNRCTFRGWCRQGRPVAGASAFVVDRWSPLEHAQRRGGVLDQAS